MRYDISSWNQRNFLVLLNLLCKVFISRKLAVRLIFKLQFSNSLIALSFISVTFLSIAIIRKRPLQRSAPQFLLEHQSELLFRQKSDSEDLVLRAGSVNFSNTNVVSKLPRVLILTLLQMIFISPQIRLIPLRYPRTILKSHSSWILTLTAS